MSEDMGISEEAQTEGGEATGDEGNPWSGVSYHDRAKQDPEFAVAELQKKDSYIGKLHDRVNKFKDLEPIVEQLGGVDGLLNLASYGYQVQNDPSLQQAIQSARNPQSAKPAKEEEDDIYDPEIKSVRDRLMSEIQEQRQIIEDLQGRLSKTEVVSLKSDLGSNLNKALSAFEGDEELTDKAKDAIVRAIETVEKAAANGDRSAARQLEDLSGPNGHKTLRMMTLDIYDEFVAKRLAAKTSSESNGEAIRSKATDERRSLRATPPPAERSAVKTGTRVTSQLVRQVLEENTRKAGKDPRAIW